VPNALEKPPVKTCVHDLSDTLLLVDALRQLKRQAYNIAKRRGKFNKHPMTGLLNEVDELDVVMEFGEDKEPAKIAGYTKAEEEAADVILTVFSLAQHYGWDVENALLAKHAYNAQRAD